MSDEPDVKEEPVFLVKVTGFSSKTTKDALLNFFENTRRSGGGEIKDIQLNHDEGFADIIFWSNQDAETVARNDNLELDGSTLITTLKPLPKELPIDPRRLHAVSISDKTTNDGLKSFMEVVSRSEVEGLLFGSNSDCIISFKEIIDFHEVQKMCKHNSLDDNFLSIEEVRICDCIEVSGLAPKTTRDAIFYYFRNKRNGGGDVKSYEDIDVSKRTMILSFEDPNVLESIMNQDHVVDGARLNVRRYYPFLGETSLINPARAEKRNIVIIDHQSALFITKFLHQEFDQLLQNSRVTYMWQQGSGKIVLGCAEPKMDKKTWEKSCEAVVAYVDQIVAEKIAVSREIWEKISDEVKEKCAVFEHQISIQHVFDFRKKENSIKLRGKKTDVCDLTKQFQDLISLAEKQIMIEKSKIVKKIEPSKVQMELLSFSGFVDGLKTRYEGLEVSLINETSCQVIQVRGLEEEVNDCIAFVWQTLSWVKESEMKFSKPVVNILASDRGKEFIATSFKENSVEATISFGGTSDNDPVLVVTAMDRNHMNNAAAIIKNAMAEERIPIDVDQKPFVESEKWKQLKLSLQQSMLLHFEEEASTSTLLLVGIKEEVLTAKEKVEEYFYNNVFLKQVIETESVAKTVLEWGKHTLDGCPLTVTKPVPPKRSPPSNEEEEIEQPVQRSRIVRVTGISDKTTKDALLNFFENTRRSGGGEIDDIQHVPEERLADITFCSPDDAERVSEKKGLELNGSKLTLTLKEIQKEILIDPYKLHVVGIGEKTTKDGLVSFMEVVSQEEVDSIFFGSNSNAMVTFKEPPDTEKVQKKCSTRALDGSHLKIEQVNICDCIEVRGLAPITTKDTVFYYFDNPRNGGGEVKIVELDSNDTRALVFFEDPSVVDIVIKRKHKINEAKLQVVPFYPFLGEPSADPGGGEKERVVKVDPQAVEFIYKFARLEFDHLLEERRVKYTWLQDSKEIVLGSTEPKMDKKTWEKSTEPVVAYVKQIVTEKITVSREAWDEMYKKAKEKCASFKDQVAVTCKEKECSFTLTGKQRDVPVFAEQLNDLKFEIEKQLEFEKNKISKSFELSEAQLQLLSLSGLVEDLQARYKDLEVKLSKKDGTINFKGPDVVVKEGNITVWQTLSRIKEQELELPKSIVAVVSSQPGKVLLATKLKKENIDAVVNCDPNSDNQLLVTAVDRKDAKKAADLIKDLTSEESIHLNDHQKRLMNSEKWNQLKRSIQQSMLLEVREEPAASTLWIAGIKEEVDHAKEKVEKFFEENIILDQVINAESGRLKFIFRCKKDTIQSLEKSFANQSVKITKETDKGSKVSALVVNGTRDGIQKVVPKVKKLLEEIKDRKVDLDKPGMKKLFSQKKGMNLLSIVENDHECVIERCTPADSRQSFSRSNSTRGNKSSSKLICSFITPEEKTILLYKGDLTEQPVDVMVNAANGNLDHIGGLAKNIVVKGGREIQDECNDHVLRNGSLLDGEVFVSKPGKLPCKRIVHAVGPDWRSNRSYNRPRALDEEKKVRLLGQTVYSSLEAAEKFSSIAVPAISGGVFGCPADVCAKTLIEGVLEYSEENSSCKLSEIRFVDMNDSVIKAFHDEMKRKFGKEHSFSDGAKPKAEAKSVHNGKVTVRGRRRGRSKAKELADEPVKDEPVRDEPATSLESESAAVYDDPNALTTALGMKILVIVGDLAKEEAHIIVNTVSSDLDLGKNACAKALSNAAGPQLQQECKAKGSLSAGQMLVTDGYNLGCKNVFHVVAGNWQSGQGESILRSLLQSCFKEADQRGFSSIAFPAIGTGNLAFPRDVVAKAFFEEADSFKIGNPQSPLNEIHLVLFHKDQPTIKAFQDELRSRKPKVAKGKRRSYAPKSEDDEGPSSREPIENYVTISQEDASGSSYIGSVRLEIVPGDITNETTDAIVTVSNPSLNVSFGGGVGAAIAKAGGPSIQQECNKLGQQKPGSVVSTSAGNLPTKYIFHLAVVSTSFVSQGISDVMVKCFRKADEMGIKSIAVPAVGTGMGGRSPKDAAKALLSAIGKFSQENPTSLKHIRIVIFQETILPVFDSAIDDLSQSKSSLLATIWKGFKAGVKGMFGFGESATGSYEPLDEMPENGATDLFHKDDKLWLLVYAESDRILSKAESDIHKLMQENSKVKDIDNKAIGKLSHGQRNRVMTMEATHDVKIHIDKRINRIVIRGFSEDVYNTTSAIYDILNETTEEEHTRRYAELLSKNIQWYYEDGDKFEPYDEKTNARIEYAYQDNKTGVLISVQEGEDDELTTYEIDFTAMIETNPDTGESARVDRRDKTKGIALPAHWDPQPKDSKSKELDLHMVVLDPVKHKKEYDEVKGGMQKTIPGVNISKIERVQNPGLYRTYAVKKQKMDDQNSANEKKLFHGTSPETCKLINHQGFNRSFCGKNATALGKGVYFARDASYSASSTYSPPDSAGNRYMYLASVLAGQYTKGHRDMITPPPKDASNATITYDTVVDNVLNPSIFVVFHDTQNYPDYLITFR